MKNTILYHRNGKRSNKAQAVLEYAVLIGVVAMAMSAMALYVKRAIQANMKTIQNQVNEEVTATSSSEQTYDLSQGSAPSSNDDDYEDYDDDILPPPGHPAPPDSDDDGSDRDLERLE